MTEHNAAIPPDDMFDRRLEELTASEFLAALSRPEVGPGILPHLPEKKKYELWTDENGPDITVRDLLVRLREEKKKLELEKPPGFEHVKTPRENVLNLRDILLDPVVIEQIAEQVAARLRQGS